MLGPLVLAALVILAPPVASAQTPGILHIRVVLPGSDQTPTPVPRHALLISDNPASTAPRRVLTKADGTVDVRLQPGNYTVESEAPVAFQGRGFQWTQTLDVRAGDNPTLELTAANADVGALPATSAAGATPAASDPALLLAPWRDSVVALWTPTAHASGFLIDARGLILTNQRVVGTAASIEVQVTNELKVAGLVVAADAARDVALVRIAPAVVATMRPLPLACATLPPTLTKGQDVVVLERPLRAGESMAEGVVSRADTRALTADLRIAASGTGGPVFTADGTLIGLTAGPQQDEDRGQRDPRIVRVSDVCEVLRGAEVALASPPPPATPLPVEPVQPFPRAELEDAAKRRGGSLNPYQVTSADFTVGFITPVMVYSAQQAPRVPPLLDFGVWAEYLGEAPPVLVVRVTPKLVESFWMKAARGAARTQGMALPAMKHAKTGFARLQAYCGATLVTPIHPFTLASRVSERETVSEGLYVFPAGAFGPHCGTARLVLYSETAPERGDTRAIDATVLQRIWQDFAAYRGQ